MVCLLFSLNKFKATDLSSLVYKPPLLRSPRSSRPQGPFRDDSFTQFLNPANTEPPFFQIFHQDFLSILGPSPSFHQIASNASFAFAHEAPIYIAETDEVFFASSIGGPSSAIRKISMAAVEAALKAVAAEGSNTTVNVPVTEVISFLPSSYHPVFHILFYTSAQSFRQHPNDERRYGSVLFFSSSRYLWARLTTAFCRARQP